MLSFVASTCRRRLRSLPMRQSRMTPASLVFLCRRGCFLAMATPRACVARARLEITRLPDPPAHERDLVRPGEHRERHERPRPAALVDERELAPQIPSARVNGERPARREE